MQADTTAGARLMKEASGQSFIRQFGDAYLLSDIPFFSAQYWRLKGSQTEAG